VDKLIDHKKADKGVDFLNTDGIMNLKSISSELLINFLKDTNDV